MNAFLRELIQLYNSKNIYKIPTLSLNIYSLEYQAEQFCNVAS